MEKVEIIGRVCQLGSVEEIRQMDEQEKQEQLLYIVRVGDMEYAGIDADKYPDNKKPLLDFKCFDIGVEGTGWEWYTD